MDLTVITSTRQRPQWLAMCLEQFRQQDRSGFTAQHLVVADGPDPESRYLATQWGATFVELDRPGGRWGAAAKDAGIALALGSHVCFWDDDNLYEPHALKTLWQAAREVDIGVVRCRYRCRKRVGQIIIPRIWRGQFRKGDIDTMCVCVRKTLAAQESWLGDESVGICTDHDWLRRLSTRTSAITFDPTVIGWHL